MAKLLMASLVDPATHPGGAGTYTRGLVAALRRSHTVDVVGPLHPPPGRWYRSRQLMSLAKSCISELPAKALFARQHEFKLRVRETARSHHYDAALINGSDMLWAIKALPPDMPTVLIAHNIEHQLLAQQLGGSPFLSQVFKPEITKQRRYEIEGFRRVRGVIFLSTTDMAWGCTEVPGLQSLHVPPLFTEPPIPRKRQPSGQLRLGFLADFAWWPNRQNWMWLMNEILTKVHRSIEVHVFGRQSEQIPTCDRVVAHGFVHKLGTVWDLVDIIICPIRTGAGVSIKLAESLYNRIPVLATTHALRGLQCQSGPGLTIVDSAEEWISFLNSPQADLLATHLPSEELSRQFAADRHMEKLENFILEVVMGRDSPVPYRTPTEPQ
jgi:glycosyl transferase family 1/glycosyl transferase family 4